MMHTPRWFRELLTETDNVTPDFLRVIACIGVLVFLVLAVFDCIVLKQPFNAISFGTGFGAVLLAAGGAVRLNEGAVAGPTTEIKVDRATVNA